MYFLLETEMRYRPNSFFIVFLMKFVLGQTFFRIRSWPMTSSPYLVHVIGRSCNFTKLGRVIPQKTPKTLLSTFLALFCCSSVFLLQFWNNQNISKIHYEYLMTSLWRHRSSPAFEKSLAQYKFHEEYNKKRIRSISLTSFVKTIQNWFFVQKKNPP